MNKKRISVIGIGTMMIGLFIIGVSFAEPNRREVNEGTIRLGRRSEANFPGLAKITFVQAVKTAMETVKGDMLKIELENENNFLVYSVEIVTADKFIVDVKVDAGSGKVLAMERDTDDDEDRNPDARDDDQDDND